MPAVNPGISVSRVGGDAQIKAMKKVSGSLKLLYSQYRELQSFAQFGSDLDADTKSRLALGERIVSVLKQRNNAPVEVAHQVCILYAVTHGYLSSIDVDKIPMFEARLYEFMDNRYGAVLEAIRTSGKLESDTEETLKTALDELLTEFVVSE
jgi:F-type H+-transporting ATPase subunit alpha